MRIAIKFAYDGRKFNGYARQPDLKTAEGEIIKSLVKHGFIEDTTESQFRSASRTDKGVSVLCNVIAFNTDTSKKRILEELSNESETIVFYGIQDVDPDFNPRYAKMRQYQYCLPAKDLDTEKIISAASSFTGTRNFSNFARLEQFKDPIRTIENIIVTKHDDFLIMDFHAQTFLWHQIRRIISALEKVGNNRLEKEQIVAALCNPDKKVDYGLAPAEPLILKDIVYDFEFEYNKKAVDKLKDMENKICTSILKQK